MKNIITTVLILFATLYQPMTALALQGDINDSNSIGLDDVITGLRVLTGSETSAIYSSAAIGCGTDAIGLEETIFALQCTSGTCFSGQALLGTLSGAQVSLETFDGMPLATTSSCSNESPDSAGTFRLSLVGQELPDVFVLVATGGINIDTNYDGIADLDGGITNKGIIHAIVLKSYSGTTLVRLNPVTEMIYQNLKRKYPNGISSLTVDEVSTLLDSEAQQLIINSTSYLDALSFNPVTDKLSLTINWDKVFSKFVSPIQEGEIGSVVEDRTELILSSLEPVGTQTLSDATYMLRLADVDSDRVKTTVTKSSNGLISTLEQKFIDSSGALLTTRIVALNEVDSYLKLNVFHKGHTFSLEGKTTFLSNYSFNESNFSQVADKLAFVLSSENNNLDLQIDKSLISYISNNEVSIKIDNKEVSNEELAILLDDPQIAWYWVGREHIAYRTLAEEYDVDGYNYVKLQRYDDDLVMYKMPFAVYDEVSGLQNEREEIVEGGLNNGLMENLSLEGLAGEALTILSAVSDYQFVIESVPTIVESITGSSRIGLIGRLDDGKLIPGEKYWPVFFIRNMSHDGLMDVTFYGRYATIDNQNTALSGSNPIYSPVLQHTIRDLDVSPLTGYAIIPPQQVSFMVTSDENVDFILGAPKIGLEVESSIGLLSRSTLFEISQSVQQIHTDFSYIVEGDTVTLDASSCVSPDGNITSYSWQHNGVDIATGETATFNTNVIFDGTQDGELTLTTTNLIGSTGEETKYIQLSQTGYCSSSDALKCVNQTQCEDTGAVWNESNGCEEPEYRTVVSDTGREWLDRNLGASRVATSSDDTEAYGDLYQWGRGTDGHEKRSSQTTFSKSSTDTPNHGKFIKSYQTNDPPYDWRSPQNHDLWQGESCTNNPCPSGFRIPTSEEWEAERLSWNSNDAAGAFESKLKLPIAGSRSRYDGALWINSYQGLYWSSTITGTNSGTLIFVDRIRTNMSSYGLVSFAYRSYGRSVRCIKD